MWEIDNPRLAAGQMVATSKAIDDWIHNFDLCLQALKQASEPLSDRDLLIDQMLQHLESSMEDLLITQEELVVQNQELTEAQHKIAQQRQRYEALFNLAPDAYLVTDEQGLIQEANDSAVKLLNMEQENLINKPLVLFISRSNQGDYFAKLQEIERQRAVSDWELEIRPRKKPSRTVSINLISTQTARKHTLELRWLLRDVTAQKQLERVEREHHAFTEMLVTTSAALNSTLEFDEVLELILSDVGQFIPHHAANIILLEDKKVRLAHCRGYNIEKAALPSTQRLLEEDTSLQQLVKAKQPIIISLSDHDTYWREMMNAQWVQSRIGAPIIADDTIIGFLNLESAIPEFFKQDALKRMKVFVDQAAQAIRNARAYRDRQLLAVIEERQRIAMELHDAVSQTLWSARLIADSLPDLWERDTEKAAEKLRILSTLISGALSEMRTLLLEMIPSAISNTPLNESIKRLADAVSSRSELAIQFEVSGEDHLSGEVREVLYRITQETLNNVVRHASASKVCIELRFADTQTIFRIQDNGKGFDPSSVPSGHYGLSIMQERADEIGAVLHIKSMPHNGTTIDLLYPSESYFTNRPNRP